MGHSGVAGTKDVLQVCEAVSLACAELFHSFAELFKDDRGSLLLWLKSAMKEENHAKLFVLLRKLQRNKILDSIELDVVSAEVTLIYVRSLAIKVKEHPPSMEEALRIAIDLETKLDDFQLRNAVKFASLSYEKCFLAIADEKLLASLREAYRRIRAAKGVDQREVPRLIAA